MVSVKTCVCVLHVVFDTYISCGHKNVVACQMTELRSVCYRALFYISTLTSVLSKLCILLNVNINKMHDGLPCSLYTKPNTNITAVHTSSTTDIYVRISARADP